MSQSTIQIDVLIPTQTKYLDLIGHIGERVAKVLDHYQGDRDALAYHLNLVLTEATTYAIKQSHATENTNAIENNVRILIKIEADSVNIKVYDHGIGVNLNTETLQQTELDHTKENNIGLFFIKKLMDSATYTQLDDGNVLEIIKYL